MKADVLNSIKETLRKVIFDFHLKGTHKEMPSDEMGNGAIDTHEQS